MGAANQLGNAKDVVGDAHALHAHVLVLFFSVIGALVIAGLLVVAQIVVDVRNQYETEIGRRGLKSGLQAFSNLLLTPACLLIDKILKYHINSSGNPEPKHISCNFT